MWHVERRICIGLLWLSIHFLQLRSVLLQPVILLASRANIVYKAFVANFPLNVTAKEF